MDSAADHRVATQGDVPYAAGAGVWTLLAQNQIGRVLTTRGPGADPLHDFPDIRVMHPTYYYVSIPPLISIAGTTMTLTANFIYAFPFQVQRQIDAGRVGVLVGTAAAGNIRLGLYNSGILGYPSSLVVDFGIVPCNVVGVQEIAWGNTLVRTGLLWLVAVSDVTPTLTRTASDVVLAPLGAPGPGQSQTNCWRVAFAFGALPANYPAGGTVNLLAPIIYLRGTAIS
jgi:hypothetical protein